MDPLPLQPESRVALLVPGSVEYVELVIALLRRGIFPIPMDPALTPSERESLLEELSPDVVVQTAERLQELLESLGPDPQGVPRGRPIHLTSGTTGRPKGVYSGLLAEDEATALLDEERELWGFRPTDINLVVSPIHHSAPLRFAMGTLLAGGRVLVPGPFDETRITEVIRAERPTSMFCVPAHLQRLFGHWDRHGWPDLSSFRLVAHAGAPCPERVKLRLLEAFPAESTWEFYGSTEGQFTACRSEEWLARLAEHGSTLGRSRPGRTMTADEDGRLWCAVPPHARFTYLDDPEKTAAAWRETPDGPAFTVGDLGRIDEDGYVYLDGRREDLIISGGVNVYPAEVERVLAQLPGVGDVAVYPMPDERWGQRVCAAVVGAVEEEALREHAREHLSPAKRPKDYQLIKALPRTPTGKVRRLELADLLSRQPARRRTDGGTHAD